MNRLTSLNVFRQVVEQGSFASAARALRLSPAAISKNISELETHLSVRLLNRTTRSMSLTELGARYYERITRILDDLDDADRSLDQLQHTPRGLLRVAAPMTLTLTCLGNAIPIFLARYPELSLDLQLDDRRVDVIEQGFDIAIRGSNKLEDSALIARKLMSLRHVVCGAPAYFERCGTPRQPAELEHHNCIQFMLASHADQWTFQKGKKLVRVPVNGPYKVNSSLAVRAALRAGFGLSLIPWEYVREDIAAGRLCTVLDGWSSSEASVYAVYPSRRYVVAKVRVFLDFLVEQLSADGVVGRSDVAVV